MSLNVRNYHFLSKYFTVLFISRTMGCTHWQFLQGYFNKYSKIFNMHLFFIVITELHEKYNCDDLPPDLNTIFLG